MGNCSCCKPRNQGKDGTGLRKDGENDAAFMYYKKTKEKMIALNLKSKQQALSRATENKMDSKLAIQSRL